ncbi:MAG: zinc-ribbon domain-containing protein [Planctomycetia bacterium]|nr:zinc-ribbon domain-containing protein [Planctomycetia bacterium]
MPIPVVCPGCKAAFNVSDKFAGKQGPCPKCKTLIAIPKLDAAQPKEEIKIHAPEEAQGGPKGASGRPVLKPIERRDARLSPVVAGGIGVAIIALFVLAWFGSAMVMRPFPLMLEQQRIPEVKSAYDRAIYVAYAIRAVALLVIGFPIVLAGYLILRDDELEPFRGRALWSRIGVCLSVYLLLWLIYALIPFDYTSSWYVWIVIGPPFLIAGFTAAYYSFDFDPTSAVVHILFFIVVTLLLGMTAGLTMPWSDEIKTLPARYVETVGEIPLYDGSNRPMNDAARKIEAEKHKKPAASSTRPAAAPKPATAP